MQQYIRSFRTTASTLAVTTALGLTLVGCGGSEESGGGKGTGAADSSAPSASAAPSSGAPASGDVATAENVQGTWAAVTDGKTVALVISGETAAIAGEHVCTGTASDNGQLALSLSCADQDTARNNGTVSSSDGRTMKVSWEGGIEDTFKKSAEGELPDGLPSLPSLPSLS